MLITRIVVEMIASFSKQFRPPAWFGTMMEPIFKITDPPIKLARRVVPPLRLGNVAVDVAVLVIFLSITLLSAVLSSFLRVL
ncbi:YGGT family protein [Corynebacterium caspium DSM 44850]|nr:YGGT family protein [Corynebacterium caspium DSM 44850]